MRYGRPIANHMVDMQHVYGKEAVKRGPDEWDARACVEGDYSWAEQQPDSDLGKVCR